MKIERDVFAQLPVKEQMLVIFDSVQEVNYKLDNRNIIKSTLTFLGGVFGGALTIIFHWAFWGKS